MEEGKVMMSRNTDLIQFLEGLNAQAKMFQLYLLDD